LTNGVDRFLNEILVHSSLMFFNKLTLISRLTPGPSPGVPQIARQHNFKLKDSYHKQRAKTPHPGIYFANSF